MTPYRLLLVSCAAAMVACAMPSDSAEPGEACNAAPSWSGRSGWTCGTLEAPVGSGDCPTALLLSSSCDVPAVSDLEIEGTDARSFGVVSVRESDNGLFEVTVNFAPTRAGRHNAVLRATL